MPEIPDITIYIEALQARVMGERLRRIRIIGPFLLRTVAPSDKTLRPFRHRGAEAQRIDFSAYMANESMEQ